jgi:hypothetical protein
MMKLRITIIPLLILATSFASSEINIGNDQPKIQISAAHLDRGYLEKSWDLTLDNSGKGSLHIFGKDPRPIVISNERLQELRKVIQQERFLELQDHYGSMPVDGPERRISMQLGDRKKKVIVYDISLGKKISKSQREEIIRALRVWHVIRSLVNDPKALDSRDEDRRFIER